MSYFYIYPENVVFNFFYFTVSHLNNHISRNHEDVPSLSKLTSLYIRQRSTDQKVGIYRLCLTVLNTPEQNLPRKYYFQQSSHFTVPDLNYQISDSHEAIHPLPYLSLVI